ncbi:MAG TPA: DUF1571 domain-containing protein, partial [Planctomycetaceae bacterium]
YWTFPPIFADAEFSASKAIDPPAAVRTASLSDLGPADVRTLPDIPLTPSIEAHRRSIALLEEGVRRLREVSGYTAVFSKQEVVDGVLTERQTMRIKLRHEPFSVYMKWIEGKPGQELLYVDGQNDGEMVVRPGGLKGRILGVIKLDPNGGMAMRESRHPVTEAGLLRLAEKVLDYRYNESSWLDGYTCTEDEAEVDGRSCHRFTIVYDSPNVRRDYRKSVIYIDREHLVVTKIENYGWPGETLPADRLDTETLLEAYGYTDINFETQLAAADFSAANADYGLRRR